MCLEAGEYDPNDENKPLYKCDFFESKAAGEKLMSLLQKGQSQPWQDTLQEFLCKENDQNCKGEMDPTALLNYFNPIINWLKEDQRNNKWEIGWETDFSKAWKPCGYSNNNPCPGKTECSTEEDWDPSWGGAEEPENDKGSAKVLFIIKSINMSINNICSKFPG